MTTAPTQAVSAELAASYTARCDGRRLGARLAAAAAALFSARSASATSCASDVIGCFGALGATLAAAGGCAATSLSKMLGAENTHLIGIPM